MPPGVMRELLGASWALATLPARVAAEVLPSTGSFELPALVDDGVELVEDTVETVVEEGVELLGDSLGLHRRVWEDEEGDHAQIEVHGIEDPEAASLRRRLAQRLRSLDQVRWAEVNAITGRVAVAFEGGAPTLSSVVELIEGIEEAYGVTRPARARPGWDTDERAEHPADDEPVHRTIALIAGDALSLGWTVVGRAARLARLPVEYVGLVSMLDGHPWLRGRVEQAIGRRATRLLLPLSGALAAGISQGPLGVLVDLGHQGLVLGELRARRWVWQQREPEFYAVHSDEPIEPPDLPARPMPLADGAVERTAGRLGKAGLLGFGGTLAVTRDPRRATDALLASNPKAARLGREGFAAYLGRTLAYRGIVPLDGSALRRLDRIDTVVLDADVLLTDRWLITDVIDPHGGPVEARTFAAAERLLDPAEPRAGRGDGTWRLTDIDDARGPLPRGAKTRMRETRSGGGLPLALHHRDEVVAIAHARRQLDPGVASVVDAVRRCGHRLVVAQRHRGLGDRIDADLVVRGGGPLGDEVRELQGQGAGVLVIARQGHRGLAAADVGLGVVAPTGRPSWGADLILGRELADAATVVDATRIAAEVSEVGARFAVAGSTLGALVSLTGPRAGAGARATAMVNGAAAASLIAGTWSAVRLSHEPRPQVRDDGRWHALSATRVLEILGVDADEGLDESQVAQRRATAGGGGGREVSPLEPFLAELANPLNPILGAGAGLSAAVGSMVDAYLVLGLIGVNTAVGGTQRLRADRTVRRLLEHDVEDVTVVRGGVEHLLREDRLVRGDVIVLRPGDAVPADARVLESAACEVDESSLTGESLPVTKTAASAPDAEVAERDCMLFEDTVVVSGSVRAVVVATGEHTQVARSLALAGPLPPSGVELRLEELTRHLLPVALGAAGLTAGAGLLRRWPLTDVAGTAVSLAVASVPEGLPFVATAGQLAGARRLASRGAVVRNPRTVEALGRVDVLCIDKTGTLTEGRIAVAGVSDGQRLVPLDRLAGPDRARLAASLRASEHPDDGDVAALDDTDEALHQVAMRLEVRADEGAAGWRVVGELPFEATRGLHAVLGSVDEGHRLAVKGAPEVVLVSCTHWQSSDGRRPLRPADRQRLLDHIDELAANGHRLLAVAERAASSRPELDEARVERLTLVGLLALADPVRPTAAEAVRGIARAGVRSIMVTGDHPETAMSIAADLGLGEGARALTGAEIDDLDDEALASALEETSIVARVTPAHKVRIVQVLQGRGRTVAMTGDGANDAAAIRLAEVGVALGRGASPAARDAADIVVTDDRIETLIDAIAEGRALWGSIREALAVLVGGNLGEIGFTGLASLFSRQAPLQPRQFLLVNLLTDLAPAVAIAVRPPTDVSPETLLYEGPDTSLGDALRRDVAIRGSATALGATGAWVAARLTGTQARAGTVGLVALVGTQLGQTVAAGGWRRPATLATGLGSAAALAAVVQTPGVSHFFGCRPLGPVGWTQAVTASVAATAGSQLAARWAP